MMIYTAELVPTYCRSSVMGMCSQASRLGSFVAPFLLMLGVQLGPVGGYSQVRAGQGGEAASLLSCIQLAGMSTCTCTQSRDCGRQQQAVLTR